MAIYIQKCSFLNTVGLNVPSRIRINRFFFCFSAKSDNIINVNKEITHGENNVYFVYTKVTNM